MSFGQAINGRYYSWSSIRFNFLGRSVTTVQGIKYKEADEFKDVKGVGTKKQGYTQDNTTTEGSITLLAETLEQLQRSLPSGARLMDIAPFDITISYRDDAGLLNTHVLKRVKLMENSREASAGSSDELSIEIPLHIHDIDWAA